MITKLCRRCNEVKAAAEFKYVPSKKDGLDSYCRTCANTYSRDWKERSPHWIEQQRQEKRFKSGNYDPIVFSRSVCAHVDAYVERAIQRFEKGTFKEAPPYLTALRDVTQSFIKEHPEKEDAPDWICVYCLEPFIRARGQAGTNCRICPSCSREARRARQRDKERRRPKRPPKVREPRFTKKERDGLVVQGRRIERKATADLAYLLRLHGVSWNDIATQLGLASPSHAHNMVHGGDKRAYAPARDLT